MNCRRVTSSFYTVYSRTLLRVRRVRAGVRTSLSWVVRALAGSLHSWCGCGRGGSEPSGGKCGIFFVRAWQARGRALSFQDCGEEIKRAGCWRTWGMWRTLMFSTIWTRGKVITRILSGGREKCTSAAEGHFKAIAKVLSKQFFYHPHTGSRYHVQQWRVDTVP